VPSSAPRAAISPSKVNARQVICRSCPCQFLSKFPVATSYVCTRLLDTQTTSRLPSGVKVIAGTWSEGPEIVRTSLPVLGSQSLILLSSLPEARTLLSGLNAREVMAPSCPLRVCNSAPLATSQILTFLSLAPDASHLPFGLAATVNTSRLWPKLKPASCPAI